MAATASPLGRHQAHLIVLAVWLGVVVTVLVIDHIRERRRGPTERPEAAPPAPTGPVSMATWPPPRGTTAPRPKREPRTSAGPSSPASSRGPTSDGGDRRHR
ncbi:MAG TPA: hypothetical protein VHE56_00460 [Mycobacteriales bacterium]|nr:hypothetical protein [Mycobacteriales bacterium]